MVAHQGRERRGDRSILAFSLCDSRHHRERKPLAERDAQRAVLAAGKAPLTFAKAAEVYFESHGGHGRTATIATPWNHSMEQHALQRLGAMDVNWITVDDGLGALSRIWLQIPATAKRLRGRIEVVLDGAGRVWANPARWLNLRHRLPKRGKSHKHLAAMSYADLPAFTELREVEGVVARTLEFIILCGARTGETVEATRGIPSRGSSVDGSARAPEAARRAGGRQPCGSAAAQVP